MFLLKTQKHCNLRELHRTTQAFALLCFAGLQKKLFYCFQCFLNKSVLIRATLFFQFQFLPESVNTLNQDALV